MIQMRFAWRDLMAWVLAGWMSLGLLVLPLHADPANGYGQGADVYTTATGIQARDQVLFITWPSTPGDMPRQLAAIDIREPDAPRVLGRLVLPGFPQGLAVFGSYVLVANGLDLLVIDAGDPASLKLVGRQRLADDPLHGPQRIAVQGDLAYLACRRGGIATVRLDDPAHPRVIHRTPIPGYARDVAVSDSTLYVAADTQGVYRAALDDKGLPTQPQRTATPVATIGRIVVQDNLLFVPGGDVVTGILEAMSGGAGGSIRRVAHTSERGRLGVYFGSYAHDLAVAESSGPRGEQPARYAYVADGEGGLLVVDVTDPAQPTFVTGIGQPLAGEMIATGIWLVGERAYVVDQRTGLKVVDITHPHAPRLVGAGVDLSQP